MDALLDSAADGILILDCRPHHRALQPGLCPHAGLSTRSRSVGQHARRGHPLVPPPQGLTLEQAEAGGWPLTPHAQLYVEGDLKRGSSARPCRSASPTPRCSSPDGSLLNIIATVRDITRFRQADELKSTFISIISHELKTPVALIKGYVSTLRREDAHWDRTIVQTACR